MASRHQNPSLMAPAHLALTNQKVSIPWSNQLPSLAQLHDLARCWLLTLERGLFIMPSPLPSTATIGLSSSTPLPSPSIGFQCFPNFVFYKMRFPFYPPFRQTSLEGRGMTKGKKLHRKLHLHQPLMACFSESLAEN